MLVKSLLAFLLALLFSSECRGAALFDLPVLPSNYLTATSPLLQADRRIPRHVWISMKTVPPHNQLPTHTRRLIKRETSHNWTVHLEDNAAQEAFMQAHFANTSTLWAYRQVSPRIGNAASDIWRYSLLWLWGGVYLDDDSFIEASFETMVRPNDSIILTKEPNAYADECYKDSFYLSDTSLGKRFGSKTRVQDVNGGRTLVSWAVFAEPKHPFIRRTLENIVELIRLEYLRKSPLKLRYYDHKWKAVMCTTGPTVLSVSVKQVLLEQPSIITSTRIEKRDFSEFGGTFKLARANGTERGHTHYMHTMQYDHALLLRSYHPLSITDLQDRLLSLERKPGEIEFRYFMSLNDSLRAFGNVEHLSLYGFTERAAFVIDEELFASLPKGPMMDRSGAGSIGVARLEKKLVAIINRRSKRSYYFIENATSHRFVNWDHFTSCNFSVDDAIPVNDAFFAKIPSAAFYRLPTAQALEGKLISLGKAFYYVSKGRYCFFRDYDHFQSSPLSHQVHDAIPVTDHILSSLPKGGTCN